jgi:arylsulfatase A-like enzyme
MPTSKKGKQMTRNKKYISRLPVLFLCLAALVGLIFTAVSCKKKPVKNFNVVLIVIDALRADHLPFYGYERDTAPFLTGLSGQSVVFENAFSASSWTSPGTASIFTSLYPYQHGVLMGLLAIRNAQRIDPEIKINRIPEEIITIPEALKENGYLTYGIADNLNIGERQGFTQGFDKFRTFMYRAAPNLNEVARSWQKKIMSSEKYFLYLHYMEPHAPYHPREPWFSRYYNSNNDNIAGKNSPGKTGLSAEEDDDETGMDLAARQERRSQRIAAYDSEINFADRHIKELFELFQWHKNTLVIITADHGEGLWDHGLMAHGKTLYREEIHVPLMIYLPGQKVARRVTTNVSTIDILPTIRDLVGLSKGQSDEGVSLVPLIENRGNLEDLEKRNLYAYLWVKTNDLMEWKSTIYRNWHFIIKMPQFKLLYSLLLDPREQDNKFGKARVTALELEKRFEDFLKRCKKFKQKSTQYKLDKKETDKLKSLGYVQ